VHAGTVDDRMYVPVFKRLNSKKSLRVPVLRVVTCINLAVDCGFGQIIAMDYWGGFSCMLYF
jgi:hypothetical protein